MVTVEATELSYADHGCAVASSSIDITIITAYSSDYSIGTLCEAVNREYAKRFNYLFHSDVLSLDEMMAEIAPRQHCTWYKVKMIRELLQRQENCSKESYVMWIDADAIFVNFEKSIEDLVIRAHFKDLIIGEDINPCCLINAGVLLIRCSEWSRKFWDDVWACQRYNDRFYYEQSAIIRCLRKHKQGLERVQPFHSYTPGARPGDKIFANVVVLPRQDFNTNIDGISSASKSSRRARSRNNNQSFDFNVRKGDIPKEDSDERVDVEIKSVGAAMHCPAGVSSSSQIANFIFHAAGKCHKLDTLKSVIATRNLPVTNDLLDSVTTFWLKRGKCGKEVDRIEAERKPS